MILRLACFHGFNNKSNPGGINVLNEPNNYSWPINEQWLRDAADRGDVIRVISNPMDVRHMFKDGTNELSGFWKEKNLLLNELGYSYDPNTFEFYK